MSDTSRLTDYASFRALWQRNLQSAAEDNSADIHAKLIQAYDEPGRFYHTLHHIQCCLGLFEDAKHVAQHADALALAIWFHDAIYEPGANDNEQRSADWFIEQTDGVFEQSLRDRVYAHIMATLHAGDVFENEDTRLMVDIDLASFGMPWPIFLRDSENVRKELPYLSDAEFYPKQCAFSRSLLDKERFFQSDYFYQHYESQARENITNYHQHVQKKLAQG